jgi:hypothetical protein
MGQAASMAQAARDGADAEQKEAKKELDMMLRVLENKRNEFLARVQLTRGEGGSKIEVQGGRSIMRTSEVRVATAAGPQEQMKEALNTFFECAQGGDTAKQAAIEGAQKLLGAGIDSLFGVSEGSAMEKTGFVVLFLNYAFVRVDYLVYTFCASGVKWGAEKSNSGACYVADLAVLDTADLSPSEIDYLLAQSLKGGDDNEFLAILQTKIMLCESAVLSRMLTKERITLPEIEEVVQAIVKTQALVVKEFATLRDFDSKSEDFVSNSGLS